ncbi:hypothetical protein Q5752_000559 [Cryptotrichosporon argae]
MFKSDKPIQIRLTEPVIFLRGPSTGTDFRGRPQAVRTDGQHAMVRGLLTLRLSKPTRIRRVDVTLEGKGRTEWPEGIGPRRTETYEEHELIRESITFFSASKTDTRSQSARRARSVGPGTSLAQYDLDDDLVDDDVDLAGVPGPDDDLDAWERDGRETVRGRDRTLRSASAMPGSTLRRSSFGQARAERGSLGLEAMTIRERGPSPAYTPSRSPTRNGHGNGGLTAQHRQLSLRDSTILPARDHVLSPIASVAPSAVNSRNGSERDDSAGTSRHSRSASAMGRLDDVLAEDAEWAPVTTSSPLATPFSEQDDDRRLGGHPSSVRFETPVEDEESDGPSPGTSSPAHRPINRPSSVRTLESAHSASTTSLHSRHDEYHPISAATQAISSTSTPAAASPALSERGSGGGGDSVSRTRTSSSFHLDPDSGAPPNHSTASSRRSSFQFRDTLGNGNSLSPSPADSRSSLVENIPGRVSRNGSTSTVVFTHDTVAAVPGPRRPSATSAARNYSANRQVSGSSLASASGHRGSADYGAHDDRGRKHGKFSLSAALRGLSQDVKDRVSHRAPSRSRTRGESSAGATPPLPGGTSASSPAASIASRPDGLEPLANHQSAASLMMARTGSGSGVARGRVSRGPNALPPGPGDFVAPYGRGGAGAGRSRSRERGESPARTGDRSESRGRGRNKAMKALTGKFGKGEHEEDDGEHNWKEFKKGTYNYPISFSIPPTAPPSIHAEFGTVVYRLKATVVRVGALTPNLVEDVEVTMIACPQEDDLEETDNVVVERAWEDQMRYQVALSGKAFPIGGTIPLSLRIMPLLKCKVHRLTVALEEKTDYYAMNRKVARHETPRRFNLMAIRNVDKDKKDLPGPLLPIISDLPTAAADSPVAPLARTAARNNPRELEEYSSSNPEDDVLATLLEPLGPWHLEKDLVIPDCLSRIKFTTKHDSTNITVAHWLKVTIRVERGDDVAVDAKGKRKQFDIIIETPIKILDCRVNTQWNSLPSYAANAEMPPLATNSCAVHGRNTALPRPAASSASSAPGAPQATARTVGLPPFVPPAPAPTAAAGHHAPHAHGGDEDTLLERNLVYDRLMSGQETEMGEEPPSYGEAVRHAERSTRSASRGPSASRSVSRVRGDAASGGGASSASRSRSRVRLRD